MEEFAFGAFAGGVAVVVPHHHAHLPSIYLTWCLYYPAATTDFLTAVQRELQAGSLYPCVKFRFQSMSLKSTISKCSSWDYMVIRMDI